MANIDYPDDAPTWPVIQIADVRAASADEAEEIAYEILRVARKADTGEAGHVAGGTVFGVRPLPGEGWDDLTVNQALVEAAIYLLRAAFQEGDDGTGGVVTEQEVAAAIDLAQTALETMKEA